MTQPLLRRSLAVQRCSRWSVLWPQGVITFRAVRQRHRPGQRTGHCIQLRDMDIGRPAGWLLLNVGAIHMASRSSKKRAQPVHSIGAIRTLAKLRMRRPETVGPRVA
jgi:hypothetical protein